MGLVFSGTGNAQAGDDEVPGRAGSADVSAILEELAALPEDGDLLEAWMTIEPHFDVPWGYSYVRVANSPDPQIAVLRAELEELARQAQLSRHGTWGEGLLSWRAQLDDLPAERRPGRVDPTWLMQNMRHVPSLDEVAVLGWCHPPPWVETWTAIGVERHAWQPAMTLHALLGQLPENAYRFSDEVHVVTPLGEVRTLGIAAWNRQSTSLAPGSRVVVDLPMKDAGAAWLDAALPRLLASRLPGDDCIAIQLDDRVANDDAP